MTIEEEPARWIGKPHTHRMGQPLVLSHSSETLPVPLQRLSFQRPVDH